MQRRACRDNGARDIRAAQRNRVDIDGIQRLMKSAIVERQRTDEKGAARERYDADPIAIQLPRHIIDRQLRARQPVGPYIGSQHASRGVDGEDDLVATAADLLALVSDLRTPESREKTQRGCQEQASFLYEADGGHR